MQFVVSIFRISIDDTAVGDSIHSDFHSKGEWGSNRKKEWWKDEDEDFKHNKESGGWSESSSFKTPQRNFQKRTLYDDGDPWGSFKGRLHRDKFDEPGRLQVPQWDELTLTPFEKNFYSEHPDVTNRTDVSTIY